MRAKIFENVRHNFFENGESAAYTCVVKGRFTLAKINTKSGENVMKDKLKNIVAIVISTVISLAATVVAYILNIPVAPTLTRSADNDRDAQTESKCSADTPGIRAVFAALKSRILDYINSKMRR